VGRRGQADAQILFDKISAVFKTKAVFFTDFWNGYHILDQDKHHAAGKEKATLITLSDSTLRSDKDAAD
jgi:hypothetical protein